LLVVRAVGTAAAGAVVSFVFGGGLRVRAVFTIAGAVVIGCFGLGVGLRLSVRTLLAVTGAIVGFGRLLSRLGGLRVRADMSFGFGLCMRTVMCGGFGSGFGLSVGTARTVAGAVVSCRLGSFVALRQSNGNGSQCQNQHNKYSNDCFHVSVSPLNIGRD